MATYTDSGTGITATGAGCNMAGAYAADVANGWGYLTNLAGTKYYYMTGYLNIGNGVDATTWSDNRMCIRFAIDRYIRVYNNATATFGDVRQTYYPYIGCTFEMYSTASGGWVGIFYDGSTTNFYGCNIHSPSSRRGYLYPAPNATVRMYGCNISYIYGIYMNSTNFIMRRCNFVYNDYGMVFYKTPTTDLSDVHSINNKYGAYPTGDGRTFTDCYLRYNDYSVRSHGDTVDFINCYIGTTPLISAGGGVVNDKKTINMKVVDKNNAPLEDVTVTFIDSEGTETAVTTDSNGDIPETELMRRDWSGTSETLTTYSPYTIKLEKAGYVTREWKKTFSNANMDSILEVQEMQTLQETIDDATQSVPHWDENFTATNAGDGGITLTLNAGLADVESYPPSNVHYEVYTKVGSQPSVSSTDLLLKTPATNLTVYNGWNDGDQVYIIVRCVDDLQTANTTYVNRTVTISIDDPTTLAQIATSLSNLETEVGKVKSDVRKIKKREPEQVKKQLQRIESNIRKGV